MNTNLCGTCGSALNEAGICNRCMFLDFDHDASDAFSLPGLDGLAEIARGGMGVVYKACEIATGRVVAVKVPNTRMWENAEAMRRFSQEVKSAALLDHPHVLPVYEVGRTSDAPFFTMKFAGGGSLADQVKDARADRFHWIAQVMAKVADAVQFAHERGVLHRDLKPQNILFDDAGEPYVADFGLAKWIEGSVLGEGADLTRTISALGTPHYLAPEIAGGRQSVASTSADVYALGAILYELLCGQPPHEGGSITLVLRNVADKVPDAPSKITRDALPKDLEAVCLKAMQREPQDRYANAGALADDLRRFVAGDGVRARPLPWPTRMARLARRHPVIASLIGAAAAVLVGGGVMLWLANGRLLRSNEVARHSLAESQLSEARLLRQSFDSDRRAKALTKLRAVAAAEPSDAVRQETVSVLALPDWVRGKAFPLAEGAVVFPAFTPDATKMLSASKEKVTLSELATGKVLWSHAVPGGQMVSLLQLSKTGGSALIGLRGGLCELWDTAGDKLLRSVTPQSLNAITLHSESSRPIWIDADGVLHVVRALDDGTDSETTLGMDAEAAKTRSVSVVQSVGDIAIAIVSGASIKLFDGKTNTTRWTQALLEPNGPVASGARLIAVADRRSIIVLDLKNGKPVGQLNGHLRAVTRLAWMPGTDTLLSASLDGTLRAWDARTFTTQWTMPLSTGMIAATDDGQRFFTGSAARGIELWQRRDSNVFREFKGGNADAYDVVSRFTASASTHYLATSSMGRARIWDTGTRTLIWNSAVKGADSREPVAAFEPDERAVVLSRIGGPIARSRIAPDANGTVRVSSPAHLVSESDSAVLKITPTHDWIVASDTLHVWPGGERASERQFIVDGNAGGWKADPSLIWLVTARTMNGKVEVRRVDAPGAVFSVPVSGESIGNWTRHHLAIFERDRLRLYETGTWKLVLERPFHGDLANGAWIASAKDGALIALQQDSDAVEIIDVSANRVLTRLEPPKPIEVQGMALSPDGEHLYLAGMGQRVYEWDLQTLHEELAKLGLGW